MGYPEALPMHPLPCEAGEVWGGGKAVEPSAGFAPIRPSGTFPRKQGKERV